MDDRLKANSRYSSPAYLPLLNLNEGRMLKIIKADEPINITTLITVISGVPGIGKTSLASTASHPILFDFDKGSYRSQFRKDVVSIEKWSDLAELSATDLVGYDTIIYDTAGRCLDMMAADIIAQDPKNGRMAGGLTLQGFGVLKSMFVTHLNTLRGFGKDIILIAHSDEQRKGDDVIERLDIQGSSKNEVYKSADAMGRIYIRNGKRMLTFSPTDTAFGKNPGHLEAMEIPDFSGGSDFFEVVLAKIKAKINEQSEASKEAQKVLENWATTFSALTNALSFNEMKDRLADEPNKVKALLLKAAQKQNIKFNRQTNQFEGAA